MPLRYSKEYHTMNRTSKDCYGSMMVIWGAAQCSTSIIFIAWSVGVRRVKKYFPEAYALVFI